LVAINASSSPDTQTITAKIFINAYNLIKQSDGAWKFTYEVPQIPDDSYPVLLTATDLRGNQGTTTIQFTVDGSLSISGTVNPSLVKSGDSITVKAVADPKTEYVVARIFGDSLDMTKWPDGTWTATYTVPEVFDGEYQVYLTATNSLGNRGIASVHFTVDNTPPALTAEVNPNYVEPTGQVQVWGESSEDARTVTANFGSQKTNLNPLGTLWTGYYTVPGATPLGTQTVDLEATDMVGNMGTLALLYNVVEPTPANPNPGEIPGGSPSTPGGSIGGGTGSGGTPASPSGSGGSSGSSGGGTSSSSSPGGSSGATSGAGSGSGSAGDSSGSGGQSESGTGDSTDDSSFWDTLILILAIIGLIIGIIMVVAALMLIFPWLLPLIISGLVAFGELLLEGAFLIWMIIRMSIPYIISAFIYLFTRFGHYITAIMQEIPFFIMNPGPSGLIQMFLRIIGVRFPKIGGNLIIPLLDAIFPHETAQAFEKAWQTIRNWFK